MELAAPEQLPKHELRNFGLTLGALFALLFGLVPFLRHHAIVRWPWALAGVLWLSALAYPRILTWPYRGWMRLGHALGWFNTRVILTVIFMVAVTPLGFILWIFGRDRMRRGFEPKRESYRVASKIRPPEGMEKPF